MRALGTTLRDRVEAEAGATQTPPDLIAVVALATLSACVIDERAGPDVESRARLRKTESVAVLAELKTWLWSQAVLKTLSIGKAAAYTISN